MPASKPISRSAVRWFVGLCLAALCLSAVAVAAPDQRVTIRRDNWGIPHIAAETVSGACYGLGYAQAEDRLEQMLRQYRLAAGTMSEVFGPALLDHDYRQRVWQHAAISQQRYGDISPGSRQRIEAFVAGARAYMQEHPERVPAWGTPPEPWEVVALSRLIIWGWPEGTAAEDLERAGITPDPIEPRGSNQWIVSRARSALGVPIALIDPHLSFYGPFRFYEARMYAGDYAVSGVCLPGLPEISLGHNRWLSFAMTTGGPDTSDVYEESVDPQHPRRYRYDGAWREMSVRLETIRVREASGVVEHKFEIEYTHHGPVVARRPGKAYVMKLSYFNEVQLVDQNHAMITSHNVDEFRAAISGLQLMEQNVMCATVTGDIYYVRNGRVPIRPAGYDFTRPVPGDTAATEWQGLHPVGDLLQLLNPPQGYMQNCNTAPENMMFDCPLVPEKYREHFYLYNLDGPAHPRAAMVRDLLAADDCVTLEEAMEIAVSPRAWGAERWQQRLAQAWQLAPADRQAKPEVARVVELIHNWNRRCDADSSGALAYRYWKQELGPEVIQADRAGLPPAASVTDAQLVDAAVAAAEKLQADLGRVEVPFGEVFRIGRMPANPVGEPDGAPARSWPSSGGSLDGMATPRAANFTRIGTSQQYMARSGQTSPQIVVLSDPPRSYTALPLGQSDDPASPHFDDQAEKLYSQGRLKSTYFLDPLALEANLESTTELTYTE